MTQTDFITDAATAACIYFGKDGELRPNVKLQLLGIPSEVVDRLRKQDLEHPELAATADKFVEAAYDRGLSVGQIAGLMINGIRGLLRYANTESEAKQLMLIWSGVAMTLIEDVKITNVLTQEGEDHE